MIRPRKSGKRGFKIDREATKARNFKHSRSFVDSKGGDHLFGEDMTDRRKEVYERDKGRCMLISSPRCRGFANWANGESDHIVPRGKGGTDDLANLRWTCAPCHGHHHVHPKWTSQEEKTA